ncbi:ATP-binding cassette domain-containing protein [Microbacterium sp. MAHUQ-60]|uniref:ATP-binding cassette domain-containing protein n=1 Tax=unclassified Microbacterium TaxID=2609290 RepID=UPI00361160E8
MPLAIDVRGLAKSFDGHRVLTGLDLTVERGEIFALLGVNGAGKTTAISILTTLLRPDRGTVRVAGYDIESAPVEVRRRISLTGQSAAVDDMLTATENLMLFARLAGLGRRSARSRCEQLLDRFGLRESARHRVGTFSGGMRRRLDLALSFVVTPEVLFLDEPTTGLDARSRRALWQVIRDVAAAGTTVFLTTQYLEEADQLADRIAVLDGGQVAALGTASQLKERVGGETVRLHDCEGALLQEVATDGTVAGLRLALDRLDESGAEGVVTLRKPTLDDVFLALTADPAAADHRHALAEESA